MIRFMRQASIKKKLLLIMLFSSFSALIFAGVFILILEISAFRTQIRGDFSAMAAMIADRSTAALTFDDRELARENLQALKYLPDLHLACIYDLKGRIFSRMVNDDFSAMLCPEHPGSGKTHFEDARLHVFQDITLDNEDIGRIYFLVDLNAKYWEKLHFLLLVYLLLFAAALLTFLLTTPLLKLISSPVAKLVDTVQKIGRDKDYSLRAVKVHNDELGVLVDAFNAMIGTVDKQNQALTLAKDRYLALYDNNPTMVFEVDLRGDIISVNHFGARQLGEAVDAMHGRSIGDFIFPPDVPLLRELCNQCLTRPEQVHKQNIRLRCDNNRIIWARATARVVENEKSQKNFLLVCEDVTETHLLAKKIAYQASHDALTKLANRNEFDNYIQDAVKAAYNDAQEHAVCYLDLDQFKVVNDTCGHMAGDELLRQLGGLLRRNIRKQDLLARLGGDEFGILMQQCSIEEATIACEELCDVIRDFHFAWQDRSFTVGVSIGISVINQTTGNAVDVLREADAACYAAKERGRNRVHVFLPDDEEMAQRQGKMQWVEKIHLGMKENLFCLYGQPIVPVAGTDEGLHFETLIRYRDGENIIPPGAFLPAAERYNISPSLDKWVIATLFEWLAGNPGMLQHLDVCSVNLSGLSFSEQSMLDFIAAEFEKWNIPKHKICFEITETSAIANLSYATRFIDHLQRQGCKFSLDDFGSGLSSFAYLKNLPVDYLKIDGLFVKDILDDKGDLAMVRSINEVGHVMGKKTIAEFVENQEILDILKQLGVDYAQGYGIGKPVPLEQLPC
ncbi:EAL domain-containing protein [Thiolapillus sp.]|uniref:EAL domain-containing protein n=1 Tax=Thiolapillus sp. TaxID=2017437 RepID=UPI003AF611D5